MSPHRNHAPELEDVEVEVDELLAVLVPLLVLVAVPVLEAEPVLELVLDPVLDPVLVLVAEAELVLDPVLVLVLELLAELDEVLVPVGVLVAEPVLVAVEVELAVEVAVAVTDCVGVGEGQLFLWAMISSPMGPSEYDPSFMPMLMHAITGSHADIAVFTLPFVKVCSVRGTFEKLLVDMRGGRLKVIWSGEGDVLLEGPAEHVFDGYIHMKDFLKYGKLSKEVD